MKFKELVCQAIKVMIYYQIIKQIDNIIQESKEIDNIIQESEGNYPFYTNIPEMQKTEVEPSYVEKYNKDVKNYSIEEIKVMKKSIINKFTKHLGKVIKGFLNYYNNGEYPEGYENTIEYQLNYYNDVIMKKILKTNSNFGDFYYSNSPPLSTTDE